ncbi:hypothetical protein GWK47_052862 [Chionoecetes opilio]|uniref:Uncharacterized protein n=1 Tax=Chionoecetes opilio TaxID=41210 RepID=A0A8J4Y625_CHIOP|nr:hypothetical protein GWK47_052862 [Chionoecetes opilio]
MALALSWACIWFVALGGTLAGTSPHAEFGVSIKPLFSTSVYIAKEPQASEDPQEKKEHELWPNQATECEIINTTKSGTGLHKVKTLSSKSFSIFVKLETSFKKLVFKISLRNVLYSSDDFYSDESITLNIEDLTQSEGSQWTHVKVEHSKHKRRGFDRHSFRISFNNITVYTKTHNSWLLNAFKGFAMFAEGGAKILFNCVPGDLDRAPLAGYMLYSMWVLAGLIIVATFLLAILCFVWMYLKHQRRKKPPQVSPLKKTYVEFDEEVMERIKRKVKALRSGKSVVGPDTVIVSCPTRQENFYFFEEQIQRGSGHSS